MATWPLVETGSTGENVKTVQYLLDAGGATLVVDGDFGPLTKAAVESYQSAHGLTADGIVGPLTWPQLIMAVSTGSNGDAVKAVQSQLDSRMSGLVAIDGVFGSETDSAVRAFQGDVGASVDGVVGPITWGFLVNGYLSSTDAESAAKAMFAAWAAADKAAAALYATPGAVTELFAKAWSAADGWTLSSSGAAAGTVGVEWKGKPGTLLLLANDGTGAPFFFVHSAQIQ